MQTIKYLACILWSLFVACPVLAQDFSQYLHQPTQVDPNADPNAASPLDYQGEITSDYEVVIPGTIPSRKLRRIDGAEVESPKVVRFASSDPGYRVYRTSESITSYMPSDGEQFGWLDFQTNPYISTTQSSGITTAMGLHLLSGPNSVPLPPRLWDFMLGYQKRDTLGDRFSYDLASSIGVYSDFEDSAREGVRPLGHAVGSFHRSQRLDWVFGVDYVNRDDYKILPVMGFSWHNPTGTGWRFDMVFPRPRIQYSLTDTSRLYMSGLLGGGTWDIEMPKEKDDVMTYRDLRILFGHEQLTPGGSIAATELGLVFNRHLQLRHSLEQVDFDDAFIFRLVARH